MAGEDAVAGEAARAMAEAASDANARGMAQGGGAGRGGTSHTRVRSASVFSDGAGFHGVLRRAWWRLVRRRASSLRDSIDDCFRVPVFAPEGDHAIIKRNFLDGGVFPVDFHPGRVG